MGGVWDVGQQGWDIKTVSEVGGAGSLGHPLGGRVWSRQQSVLC